MINSCSIRGNSCSKYKNEFRRAISRCLGGYFVGGMSVCYGLKSCSSSNFLFKSSTASMIVFPLPTI